MRRLRLALVLAASGCAALPIEPPRSSIRVVSADGCAPFDWPVEAVVSSGFGPRDGHAHLGLDLAVPEGTPVRAACAGVVRYAGDGQRGYGRLVVVDHAGGLSTAYAHNRALAVEVGAVVARGQLLSYSGATGHVTAPHLHFEVRRDGVAVDPLPLLAPGSDGARMGYALRSASADPSHP